MARIGSDPGSRGGGGGCLLFTFVKSDLTSRNRNWGGGGGSTQFVCYEAAFTLVCTIIVLLRLRLRRFERSWCGAEGIKPDQKSAGKARQDRTGQDRTRQTIDCSFLQLSILPERKEGKEEANLALAVAVSQLQLQLPNVPAELESYLQLVRVEYMYLYLYLDCH